eukprot:gene6360-6427_t
MSDVLKAQRPGVNIEDFERQLYASAKPAHVADDPLAELSRIVGKADPFRSVFAKPAPSSNPPPDLQSFRAPSLAFTPPIANVAALTARASRTEPSFSPQPNVSPEAETGFGPNFFDRSAENPRIDSDEADFFSHLSPGTSDQPSATDYQMPEVAAAAQPRSGRKALVAVLVVAALGAAAALGIRGIDRKPADGSVPVIKAAQTPVKVEPVASDADKAKQDEAAAAKDGTVKVTTKEEVPVEVVQPNGSPPIKIARIIPLSGSQARPPDPATTATPTTPGAPVPANGYPEPHTVKTVSVRPDGTVIGGDKVAMNTLANTVAQQPPVEADAQPANVPVPQSRPNLPQATAAPSRTPVAANSPDTTIAKPVKTTTPKTPTRALPSAKLPVDPNAPLQLTPSDAPAAKPAKIAAAQPVAAADATTTATTTGDGFAAQLGTAGSEAEARTLAGNLRAQYGASLGGQSPVVRKADVNGKTVYRVRVVGLARDEAVNLCEKLKGAGGQCFVAR